MPRWQKYVIHPLTALLLAGSAAAFIHRFELLDFDYAPALSFLLVLTSYLLLSKKYDPILSVIGFSFALVLAYKAARLPETHTPSSEPRQNLVKNLSLLAALTEQNRIETGQIPGSLEEIGAKRLIPGVADATICPQSSCPDPTPDQTSRFWIFAPLSTGEHDKAGEIWYINDRFELFSRKPDGSFQTL